MKTLDWPAQGALTVSIARQLITNRVDRNQLERSLAEAATEIVSQREKASTAAGEALGKILSETLESSEFTTHARQTEDRAKAFAAELEARRAAIQARRDRRSH